MPRLFIAASLNKEALQKLESLSFGIPEVRWQRPDQMHCTLKFIGDCDHEEMDEICSALEKVESQEFSINLKGVGVFPNSKSPKVLWAGVEESPVLINLKNSIEKSLVEIGIAREKKRFRPHITLARLKNPNIQNIINYLKTNHFFNLKDIKLEEFHLFSSLLSHKGAKYRIEQSYFLG